MEEKSIIKIAQRELKRLKVIQEVMEKRIAQKTAGIILGIGGRQVRRLANRVKEEGPQGIIHRARGKSSNRKIPDEVRDKVIKIYETRYRDFGPTLSSEKLLEKEKIEVCDETLRIWLIEEGLWKIKRKRRKHRTWRQRKECLGQMVQMDGSHHDWLEGRGPKLVLMGYIDDATGRVYARFYDYEGTFPAMDSFKRYIKKYGIPHSVYLDKHSTYKSTRELSIEEQLEGREEPLSQFQRALKELAVEVIYNGAKVSQHFA